MSDNSQLAKRFAARHHHVSFILFSPILTEGLSPNLIFTTRLIIRESDWSKRMIHEELRVPKQNLFMGLLLLSPHGNQQQGESLVLLRFNSCMVPGHLYSYATTIYRKDNNRMEKRIKKKSHVVSIMCRLVSYRRVIADGGGGGDGCCWSSGRQKSRQIVTSESLFRL